MLIVFTLEIDFLKIRLYGINLLFYQKNQIFLLILKEGFYLNTQLVA